MAKAPAKPEAATEAPAPRKSGKLLLIILILLVVVLIIVAVGVGVLVLLKGKGGGGDSHAPEAQHAPAPPPPAATAVDLSKPPSFVTLEPFTVNLQRDEGDHYLQAVVVLRVADAKTAESLKGFMPEIRHRINLLLSSKLPSQLSTIDGRETLAIEIVDQSNDALGFPPPREANRRAPPTGPIQAVLFNSFIIQ
ncbi:flagellar basal body-associated protein FliL [Azoarcus olearius]|uniref:Flagellar protein FliL n=1 Tax=Azoarcus sp. (strain BH72) TaxID=418699 RepID=A1K933_AZOSB|nr:flagellar basal body-associated FliL family protein [Azoarcus olearius]ANQ85885.1 putative flagellar basal body-associated protein FliL [Azoarcus olearius]CAL95338.1 putative flagellar basal body-associated protein FliL [Azoarcus olearius]